MTFQEALMRRGVRFRLGVGDHGKVLLCCPFCPERGKPTDTQFRLCVHAVQGWGKCVHCEWKSRFAVVPVLRQLNIVESVSGFNPIEQEHTPPVTLPRDFAVLTRVYDDLDRIARKYLLNRGVSKEQIDENQIGVSYSGRFAYRILFPVYQNKSLKGIVARDFTGTQKPKYLNSVGEKYLYHFDPKAEICILSEGVFKALRIQHVTSYCSAALLGHNLTSIQLKQIQDSKCRRVILYPDVDTVGRKGVIQIADQLSENWKGRIELVDGVLIPADESPLGKIETHLQNTLAYSWAVRQKIVLAFSGQANI